MEPSTRALHGYTSKIIVFSDSLSTKIYIIYGNYCYFLLWIKKYAKALLHSNFVEMRWFEFTGHIQWFIFIFVCVLSLAHRLFVLLVFYKSTLCFTVYGVYSMAKNFGLLFSSKRLNSSYSFVFNGRIFLQTQRIDWDHYRHMLCIQCCTTLCTVHNVRTTFQYTFSTHIQ